MVFVLIVGEPKKKGERRMKSASFRVFLVLSMAIMAFALILVKPVAANDPIIVGKWDRTDGVDVYTIYANRTTQTIIEGQAYYGTWDYDGSSGYQYIFHWEHSPPGQAPFIDYVTVAADGQSYSGYNNYGDQFHCVRIGGGDSTTAANSAGFPIVYVAIGGGIAAAIGAAVYYYFIAARSAEAATSAARSAVSGVASGAEVEPTVLADTSSSNLSGKLEQFEANPDMPSSNLSGELRQAGANTIPHEEAKRITTAIYNVEKYKNPLQHLPKSETPAKTSSSPPESEKPPKTADG